MLVETSNTFTEEELIRALGIAFSREDAKTLLINDYEGDLWYTINKSASVHCTGFCFLASEVFYRAFGGAKNWWFKKIESPDLPYTGVHWFLENKSTGMIVDITAAQFNVPIPYALGKKKGIRFFSKNGRKLLALAQGIINE